MASKLTRSHNRLLHKPTKKKQDSRHTNQASRSQKAI